MPTYEYVCEKCGHEFEAVQSMSAPALKICPKELCAQKKWGRGKVAKQIGAGAGLLFKGGGFYITDYRSEGYKQSAKKDSTTPPAKTETKSEAKTEAKTEAKPAAKPVAKPAKK
jgi:putative FmdB family regulatory protein